MTTPRDHFIKDNKKKMHLRFSKSAASHKSEEIDFPCLLCCLVFAYLDTKGE